MDKVTMYQDVSWSVVSKLTFHNINHTEAQEAWYKVG